VAVGFVTANAFDVLGARPALGRTFTADEDRPGGAPVAVLGHALWQERFGGDAAVVGRRLEIDGEPVEVIGVMPEGFRLPTDFTSDAAEPTRLWRPLQLDPAALQRGNHGYYAAAVLAPGQTAAGATEELRAITRRLTERGDYPEAMQFSAFAVPLEDEIRGGLRPALWLLTGAVGCLLLIACANVANLLLVRGDARMREIAVRTAVGATPGRLVRQLLTESLLLAVPGSALGLGLAAAGLEVLKRLGSTTLPPIAPVGLDLTVVFGTLLLGVATTLLFGLVPAIRTLPVNLVDSLREGGTQATSGRARQRLRGALVVTEVALAAVLVIGAGLMIRTLGALGRIDLGFTPERVLTLSLSLPERGYDTPEKVVDFYQRLLGKVRALPGVEAAGALRSLPLATTIGDMGLDIEGYEESPGRNAKGDWQIATDGAFEAMRTRLVLGRWFGPADTSASTPVAVVNESLARAYWRNPESAIGGHLRVGSSPTRPWTTVVGIVADERHNGVTGVVKEKFYIPHSQWHVATQGSVIRNAFIVVRTAGDPWSAAAPVRAAVREIDPRLPVAAVRPMTEIVAASLATTRLTGFLMGTFAAIALLLAAVGIYGLLAYLVARRTQEIGIRMALGAGRGRILGMVLRRGLALAGGGVVAGVTAGMALTRLMQSLLYQVRPLDVATFLTVPAVLLLAALVAGALPALRATRISPMTALRSE
jgi:predicted permease